MPYNQSDLVHKDEFSFCPNAQNCMCDKTIYTLCTNTKEMIL